MTNREKYTEHKTPELIFLVKIDETEYIWADEPAPGLMDDPEDAIKYVREDCIPLAEMVTIVTYLDGMKAGLDSMGISLDEITAGINFDMDKFANSVRTVLAQVS